MHYYGGVDRDAQTSRRSMPTLEDLRCRYGTTTHLSEVWRRACFPFFDSFSSLLRLIRRSDRICIWSSIVYHCSPCFWYRSCPSCCWMWTLDSAWQWAGVCWPSCFVRSDPMSRSLAGPCTRISINASTCTNRCDQQQTKWPIQSITTWWTIYLRNFVDLNETINRNQSTNDQSINQSTLLILWK